MLYKLDFANNAVLSCFFFFFLMIYLYFLIPAVITQINNFTAELVMPTGIPNEEAKAEMETHRVTVKTKIIKCLI